MILVHVKKKRFICNFDSNPSGRTEVQKNKRTPHYQTELDGESEKNNRFAPRKLLFLTKYGSLIFQENHVFSNKKKQ